MLAPGDVLAGMDRWVETFDEPFGDHAALPTMALAEFARKTVKVVLTGEGADEVFGGYANYAKRVREERITRILGAKRSPLPWLLRRLPGRLRRDRILKAALEPDRRRYTTIPNIFDSALRRTYLTDSFRLATQTTLADRAELFFTECDSPSYLDRLLNIDTRLWLPDDLLAKVDRATMAFSLEARVPYLDQDLVGWCARLDPALKVSDGGVTKVLLKQLAERYLPREIVYRSKQGFTMPLDRWMANELRPDISIALGPEGLERRGLIRVPALRRICAEHYSGRKNHCHALVDTPGPRALVRAVPTGIRRVINASFVDRSYRDPLRLGWAGDPHPHRSLGDAGARSRCHAGRAAPRRRSQGCGARGDPGERRCRSGRKGCSDFWCCVVGLRRSERTLTSLTRTARPIAGSPQSLVRRMRDPPPIVRTRHVSTKSRKVRRRAGSTPDATAHIVTTGEALRDQLATRLRIPGDRMTSVPTGIDLARFVPGDADAARRRLGMRPATRARIVATLRDWKGHDYLFEAIALDRSGWNGWAIIIVGDGPHRPKLEAHLAALGPRRDRCASWASRTTSCLGFRRWT